jgi:hypothetical protein
MMRVESVYIRNVGSTNHIHMVERLKTRSNINNETVISLLQFFNNDFLTFINISYNATLKHISGRKKIHGSVVFKSYMVNNLTYIFLNDDRFDVNGFQSQNFSTQKKM